MNLTTTFFFLFFFGFLFLILVNFESLFILALFYHLFDLVFLIFTLLSAFLIMKIIIILTIPKSFATLASDSCQTNHGQLQFVYLTSSIPGPLKMNAHCKRLKLNKSLYINSVDCNYFQ